MFTIEHKRTCKGKKHKAIWSDTPQYPAEFEYAVGKTPPRYPVPAIPHWIEFYDDAVWYCQEPNKLVVLAHKFP